MCHLVFHSFKMQHLGVVLIPRCTVMNDVICPCERCSAPPLGGSKSISGTARWPFTMEPNEMQSSKHEISFPVIFLCFAACISFSLSYLLTPTNPGPVQFPSFQIQATNTRQSPTQLTIISMGSIETQVLSTCMCHARLPVCGCKHSIEEDFLISIVVVKCRLMFRFHCDSWKQISVIVCSSDWVPRLCPNEETQTK